MEGTHKLSVLMFTDIVGYSTMTHRREALALELLEEHRILVRELVARHRGREIETIGDAFLVSFASAVDAVECAEAIQLALHERNGRVTPERRLELRIGLHLGEIIESDGRVYGDSVNIAARLLSLAGRAQIVFSESVYQQIHNKLEVIARPLGARRLKGIGRRVLVYCIDPIEVSLGERVSWSARAAVTAIALSAAVLWSVYRPGVMPIDPNRVAVVPFVNASHQPENEYLADGLTDELIADLSHLPGKSVLSRNTMMQYRNSPRTADQIGEKLGAGLVVTGELQRRDGILEVTMNVVDRARGGARWSRKFPGHVDAFSQVHRQMAGELNQVLLPGRTVAAGSASGPRDEAYFAYLRGRFALNQRTPQALHRAVRELENAIAADPQFADAYTSLATAHAILAFLGYLDPREAFPKASAYAEKGLLLNSQSSDAFLYLAIKKSIYDSDWSGAEAGFRRAIELAPGNAAAHSWYAQTLMSLGRYEEAHREAKIGIELDPMSLSQLRMPGIIYAIQGDYEASAQVMRNVIAMDDHDIYSHFSLGLTLIEQGKAAEAIHELQLAGALSGDAPMVRAALGYAYGLAGQRESARKILRELRLSGHRGYFPSYLLAEVHAGLGNTEAALAALENAVEMHDTHLTFLAVDPVFKAIRGEPRFRALLHRLNFDDRARELATTR